MRPLSTAFAALCATALIAGGALAVEIENQDDQVYEVTIIEGQDQSTFTLGPGMKESDLCEGRCTIAVEGRGQIEAEEDDVVVIRGGELTKRL